MASETCGRLCRVQSRVFEPTCSISSRLSSSFRGLDKLAGAQAPPLEPSNVFTVAPGSLDASAVAPVSSKALLRVYLNEKVQDIIWIVIEAKIAATKNPREYPFKAQLPNIYWGNNHMACYNFCQQYEDHFATAVAKKPNRILFAASFL